MSSPSVVIIEDESDILEILQYNLELEGYKTFSAKDGERGIKEVLLRKPSMVLLDLMLPGMSGTEVCRLIRKQSETAKTPIIMLTAKGEESDIVHGLEVGADDYITKPFSVKEVVARVRAVLRRGQGAPLTPKVEFGPIAIDVERHEVLLRKVPVVFTVAEFRLLKALLSSPGRVFTRDQLLSAITGGETVIVDRNVDVHIRAVRKKLGKDGKLIQTVRGIGYKLQD